MNEAFHSQRAPEPVGLYPHARTVGNLLFLSGVGPRSRGTKEIPGVKLDDNGSILAYNIEEQCRSVFENVRLILEEAGSSWDRLVDVTVFLTNMKEDFATYNRIYAEYFKDNQPCRTTVEINSLPTPIAIELKCIATIETSVKAVDPPKQEHITPPSPPANEPQEQSEEAAVRPNEPVAPAPTTEAPPAQEVPMSPQRRIDDEDDKRPPTPIW